MSQRIPYGWKQVDYRVPRYGELWVNPEGRVVGQGQPNLPIEPRTIVEWQLAVSDQPLAVEVSTTRVYRLLDRTLTETEATELHRALTEALATGGRIVSC